MKLLGALACAMVAALLVARVHAQGPQSLPSLCGLPGLQGAPGSPCGSMQDQRGTMEFPATTCRTLFLQHPELRSGDYFIDPNGGDKTDAVKVYCDAASRASCVSSTNGRMLPLSFSPRGIEFSNHPTPFWLSEIGAFQYKIFPDQLSHLQSLSKNASQYLTYGCRFDVSLGGQPNHIYLQLQGWNDVIMVHEEDKTVPVHYLGGDACNGLSTDNIALRVVTNKVHRLPVTDIYVPDAHFQNIRIGRACFT